MTRAVVVAAGGAVWRPGPEGPEVLVVHRFTRQDWSLPKGKLDPGETLLECALREVEEETGWRCAPEAELGAIRYETPRGEDKTVHWWVMTPLEDRGFEANAEVDERVWLGLEEAAERVSFDTDRAVLASLRAHLTEAR